MFDEVNPSTKNNSLTIKDTSMSSSKKKKGSKKGKKSPKHMSPTPEKILEPYLKMSPEGEDTDCCVFDIQIHSKPELMEQQIEEFSSLNIQTKN